MITEGAITIYNRRLGDDRRDVYIATKISEASFAESRGSIRKTGDTAEALDYMIRIPITAAAQDGRQYAPEAEYKKMSEAEAARHWTLSQNDLITRGSPLVNQPATEKDIRGAAEFAGVDVIAIAEYADNTHRGSPAVQHWRVGGK